MAGSPQAWTQWLIGGSLAALGTAWLLTRGNSELDSTAPTSTSGSKYDGSVAAGLPDLPSREGVTPAQGGVAPSSRGEAPTSKSGASNSKGVGPDPWGVAPISKDVAPSHRGVASSSKDVAPCHRGVASYSKDVAPSQVGVVSDQEDVASHREGKASDGSVEQARITAPTTSRGAATAGAGIADMERSQAPAGLAGPGLGSEPASPSKLKIIRPLIDTDLSRDETEGSKTKPVD